MPIVIPVASGKGGVGKSTVTANLAIALAQAGHSVVAVDLDLGGSNLHTCLGVKNTTEGIASFLLKKEKELTALLVPTSFPRLALLPGDGLIPGTMNIPFYIKRRLLTGLAQLPADYVLLDLSAGSSTNTLDFFLLSPWGIMVTLPETTAILNAYAFLKAAAFRFLTLSFPAKSEERHAIEEFMVQKMEGSQRSLSLLVELMAQISPASGSVAQQALDRFHPGVVLNMGKSKEDFSIGTKLRDIVKKNLTTDVTYLGALPWEENSRAAINARRPLTEMAPHSPFVQGVTQLAKIIRQTHREASPLYWEGAEDENESWGSPTA